MTKPVDRNLDDGRVERWLEMLRSGNQVQREAAWSNICNRYREPVRRVALKILDGNQERADEVENDTFPRVWRTFPNFRGTTEPEFTRYVLLAGRNCAISVGRRLTRERKHRTPEEFEESLRQFQAKYNGAHKALPEYLTEPDFAQQVADSLSPEPPPPPVPWMNDGLKLLTKTERAVFKLASVGCEAGKISSELGTSLKSVYSHLSRARTKLRNFAKAWREIERRNGEGDISPT